MSTLTLPEMQALVPAVPSLSITGHTPSSVLAVFIVLIIFLAVSVSIAVLRVLIRLRKNNKLYLNDYFLILGTVFATAESVCTLTIFCHGVVGHHIVDVAELVPNRLVPSMKLVMGAQYSWVFAVVLIKLSILHLYVQVFGQGKIFLWAAHILAFIVTVTGLVTLAIMSTNCIPFTAYWDPTPSSHCVNQTPSFIVTGALNLALDASILALPMPLLWALQMSPEKKARMSFIFGMGFGICGISGWRLYIISNHLFADLTYPMQYMSLSTSLELLLGVIISCIPIVSPAFGSLGLFFSSLISLWSRHSTKNSSSDTPNLVHPPRSQRSSKIRPTESQVDRKNFKKLYNHLYPMSDLNNTEIRAGHLEGVIDEQDGIEGRDIKVTTGWSVRDVGNRS